jgi:hypothetical protein
MKVPSSFRYFTLADLEQICQIESKTFDNLLAPITPAPASEFLLTLLGKNLRLPLLNEKAKSELLIAPILVEMWDRNPRFKPFSGMTLNMDAKRGLKGVCDFLISAKEDTVRLDAPIACVFEAKNDNLDDWFGQCGSEMYASRLFNQQEGEPYETIFGAVTNGTEWQFLKLHENTLWVDTRKYAIANLPDLLGAIQKVYDFYKR